MQLSATVIATGTQLSHLLRKTGQPGVGTYEKSKKLAERAALDFVEKEGGSLALSSVNPANIMGTVLGTETHTSIEVATCMSNGAVPGCPNIEFCIIDVRDVADLHLLAMTHLKAKGVQFLCILPRQC